MKHEISDVFVIRNNNSPSVNATSTYFLTFKVNPRISFPSSPSSFEFVVVTTGGKSDVATAGADTIYAETGGAAAAADVTGLVLLIR